MEKVRIQKALSDWGVASRRAVEEMVVEGLITVNGNVVNELPFFIDPEKDEIFVDGKPVHRRAPQRAYFLLNKPRGAVCTATDAIGRPLAISMVPAEQEANTVVEVLQKGYTISDRLLRPALVTVAQPK